MGFRENVRTLLSKRRWSQRELAAAAGISPAAVSQILAGSMSPTLSMMNKIASAFDVSVPDLTRDEPPAVSRDELEVALRHEGDLTDQDIRAVHAFIAYIRGEHGKGGAHGA